MCNYNSSYTCDTMKNIVIPFTARNYGYAKFATKECAMKAIQTLHGQNLAGNRLKVLEAEPPRGPEEEEPSKKPRM